MKMRAGIILAGMAAVVVMIVVGGSQSACAQAGISAGWRSILPDSFLMGSPSDEPGHDDYEGPQTWVTFNYAFSIMRTEVTQGDWKLVMGTNPSEFKDCGDDCPVENVTWNDAVEFCNRMSKKDHLQLCYDKSGDSYTFRGVSCTGYRLPTEAEWEYAARAGSTSARYGDLDAVSWHGNNSYQRTHRVGLKQPNKFGLYDMLGNVGEWCSDWVGKYPGGMVDDPTGPSSGTHKIFRGGGWDRVGMTRLAARGTPPLGWSVSSIGFRMCRSIP